nr:o-acetyltransferase anaat [Quercus suber]
MDCSCSHLAATRIAPCQAVVRFDMLLLKSTDRKGRRRVTPGFKMCSEATIYYHAIDNNGTRRISRHTLSAHCSRRCDYPPFTTIQPRHIRSVGRREVHKPDFPSQATSFPSVSQHPHLIRRRPCCDRASPLACHSAGTTSSIHSIETYSLSCFGMDPPTYRLSVIDQAVPRIYTRKVYTFAFPEDEVLRHEANDQIKNALAVLSKRWPFILGLVGSSGNTSRTAESATKDHMLLFSQRDGLPPNAARTHHDTFYSRNLHNAIEESYQQLCDRSMPPSCMINELLYSPPHLPGPSDVCAAFGLNANYIKGGLLLCFNFHHCIFDGTSCVKLMREFARLMRRDLEVPGISVREVEINDARKTLEEVYSSTAAGLSISAFPEYAVDKLQIAKRAEGFDITKRVIVFSSETVDQLKTTINAACWQEKCILSKQACLAALIWVVVMRARATDLDPCGTAKLGIAVDFRPRMKNVIPSAFMGNAIVHTLAQARVDKLAVQHFDSRATFVVRPKDAACTIRAILIGALQIRDAVDTITEDAVRDRLHLFATTPDPSELHKSYTKALDLSGYGLDFSSWKDQCADLDFGIKGAVSKSPEYVRMTWLASEGALNILPRRNGSDGDANWEILLGLREADWVGVMDDLLLGGWATRIVL